MDRDVVYRLAIERRRHVGRGAGHGRGLAGGARFEGEPARRIGDRPAELGYLITKGVGGREVLRVAGLGAPLSQPLHLFGSTRVRVGVSALLRRTGHVTIVSARLEHVELRSVHTERRPMGAAARRSQRWS